MVLVLKSGSLEGDAGINVRNSKGPEHGRIFERQLLLEAGLYHTLPGGPSAVEGNVLLCLDEVHIGISRVVDGFLFDSRV